MPSLTPKALAVALARARLAAIGDAADLLDSLGAVSAAVVAGAMHGLALDAERAADAAQAALDAEVAEKDAKASAQETLA